MVCSYCNTVAQTSFEKYFDANSNYQFNLIEMESSNLFIGMGGPMLMSSEGIPIHSNYYLGNGVLSMQSVKMESTNSFVFTTGYYSSYTCTNMNGILHQRTYPIIGKMDSMGSVNTMQRYELTLGCQDLVGDFELTEEGGIVAWNRDWSFFALKTDSTLTPTWAKHFDRHGGFQFIKELPGGDLLAGINMDTAGAVVARMDANGNFLWCKSYIRPKGRVHDAVIESDSSFIITGFTEYSGLNMFIPYPPSFHPQLYMMKLDGRGEVQWCKGYDSAPDLWYTSQWSRIEKAQDGNYVVLATLGRPQNNFFHRPFLMKTDPNGDTLWTRSVGTAGKDYFTRSLLVCSDGGLMFSGAVWGNLPGELSMSYIFKTDSLGHFDCDELHYPIVVSDLFPVDSSFTLTSVDGATAYPAYVQDTVYDAIQVYNACTHTGVPNLYNYGHSKPRIRPNPNTGHFTVEFTDPLSTDSFYSVYDAVGKLLFQRPLAKGTESEEVDLSRFGKGTYVVRITSKDGVCNERVVVQ